MYRRREIFIAATPGGWVREAYQKGGLSGLSNPAAISLAKDVLIGGQLLKVLDKPSLETPLLEAEEDILASSNYPAVLRQKMIGFWLNGQRQAVEYSRTDGSKYLFTFQAATPVNSMGSLAQTEVTLQRRNITSGGSGSALVFGLKGQYLRDLGAGLDKDTQNRFKQMNFEHEAITAIALINGLVTIGRRLGLNFNYPTTETPGERNALLQSTRYIPTLISIAESVGEVNDYLLTFPLLDKNPNTGEPIWSNSQNTPEPLPRVQGLVFTEGGLTYIVNQTIGPSIRRFSTLDELSQTYSSLSDIPGYQEYLTRIKKHLVK